MTEKMQLENTALEKYIAVFKDLSISLGTIDLKGRQAGANKAFCDLLGYKEEELIGQRTPFPYWWKGDLANIEKVYQELFRKGSSAGSKEMLFVKKEGAIIPVSAIFSDLRDEEDRLIGYSGFVADRSERKKMEERLVRINSCFLNFVPEYIKNIKSLTALCGEIFDAACALYNRLDTGMLYSLGQWHTPLGYRPLDKPDGHICYDVIKNANREVFLVRNLPETVYAKTDPNVSKYKLKTYMGMAVRCKADCVGSLCVVFQEDFIPSEDDKDIMGIIASAVGKEEERGQAEEALHESEQRYRAVVDNIGIGISVISPKMEILSLNQRMKEWFPDIDVSRGPICYRAFNKPPRKEICSYCPTHKTLQDGLVHEAVTETPAGDKINNYRVISSAIKDKDGEIIAAIEMVEDITERKKAEVELEKKIHDLGEFYKAAVGKGINIERPEKEAKQLKAGLQRPRK